MSPRKRCAFIMAGVAGLSAGPAVAATAISRFDSGLEGWTLTGPGQLEWVAAGGNAGGYIRVTRTGPGEVFLEAPSGFQGSCSSTFHSPTVWFSVRTGAAIGRSIGVEIQTATGALSLTPFVGCQGCWFPANASVAVSGPATFQSVRIRVGVDPALPVGEVMEFDNVEFRTSRGNCDGSTATPHLTANDFQCFINAFASGDPYANFDGSIAMPAVNANDFQAFMSAVAMGSQCP